jgi:filamentous hemagglutinin
VSEDPILFAGGDINLYSYVFNQPTGLRDHSGMVVDPISWTAAAIVCGGGATVGVSYMVFSGRKPTLENLAAGAAAGCGAGMIALVSWIVAAGAGAVAITADIAGGTAVPAAVNIVNQGSTAILRNGYYEVNGFRYSQYYYERLWTTGRPATSLWAQNILNNATTKTPHWKQGFFKYEFGGWGMVYNPVTREIWHIAPTK